MTSTEPEIRFSALPAAAAPDGTEIAPVVQGGVTKKIPVGAANGLATLGTDGKLKPSQSATNAVLTDTVQTITGLKTFNLGAITRPLNLVFDGDSLTTGTSSIGGALSYPLQTETGLDPRTVSSYFGVGGQTIAAMESDAATQIDPLISATKQNVLCAWGGTNDLYYGATAATTQTRIQTYCANRRAAGWKVIVLTILPRSDAGTPANFETDRLAVNTWLRANYATFADGLADVAADTRIGDSGDEASTVYYSGDLVHLSGVGYRVVARIVQATLAALGYDDTHGHDGVYAVEETERIITAGELAAFTGAPILTNFGNQPVWQVLNAAVTGVAALVTVPRDWLTYNVDLYWSADTTGDVVWRGDHQPVYDGSNLLTGASTGAPITVTVPAGYITKVTTLRIDVPTTPTRQTSVRVLRDGGNAADTCATDLVYVLGIRLRRTS